MSTLNHIGPFEIVPLASERMNLIAELYITFLRPEEPGSIISQGEDIDNRLKTLFDGLRMPKDHSELSSDQALNTPAMNEVPFYCLLEDENLITKIQVETQRLLTPAPRKASVLLVIKVVTKGTAVTWKNLSLL